MDEEVKEGCTHDCSTCKENCAKKQDFHEPINKDSSVRHVYAVVSGKGGVGKSTVTALLATLKARLGERVGILDADITGPSIPKAFGITTRATSDGENLLPVTSQTGLKVMSMNCLLDSETEPVVWRGPVIAGVLKQFWTDVKWGDLDTMFIDCPPGTGDVPLTVFQTFNLDGIIMVTTPQELVGTVVKKAAKMASLMNIPILAVVENMSYYTCDGCGKTLEIFGKSQAENLKKELGAPVAVRLPINEAVRSDMDNGVIEYYDGEELKLLAKVFENEK